MLAINLLLILYNILAGTRLVPGREKGGREGKEGMEKEGGETT